MSLCFFFALLDIRGDNKEKILVFDDPITSLDNNNLSYLVNLIAEKSKEFSQIFIFTHHRVLFKFLRHRFSSTKKKESRKAYEYNILKNKKRFGGSFICQSNAGRFINKKEDVEKDLLAASTNPVDLELKIVEYGQYLRYEVERFIKYELLHWDARNLHEAIKGLKKSQKVADDELDKLQGIYSFCNWTTSHVDVGDDHGLAQLKSKINDFFDVFNSYKQQKGECASQAEVNTLLSETSQRMGAQQA